MTWVSARNASKRRKSIWLIARKPTRRMGRKKTDQLVLREPSKRRRIER